jgi:hypothetical protein
MDIFQRSVHSNVKEIDDEHWLVSTDLLDLEHSIHLELTVRSTDGLIERARAQMSKVPFDRCLATRQSIEALEGLVIERGVLTAINAKLGGPRSCAHLLELAIEAVRLVGMMRLGRKAGYLGKRDANIPEDELIEGIKPKLKNSCMVFADGE